MCLLLLNLLQHLPLQLCGNRNMHVVAGGDSHLPYVQQWYVSTEAEGRARTRRDDFLVEEGREQSRRDGLLVEEDVEERIGEERREKKGKRTNYKNQSRSDNKKNHKMKDRRAKIAKSKSKCVESDSSESETRV